ncbi:Hsp20/alpha crystallin family protein [Gorillibacterium timonense]|uniref:Hsp20/alpha crystallin family protein n=1 Tax=Gorillibacterium timonense TaxID=1689269 RepID=UPI00071D5B13|nr:Hsp20/alpha crystallin family protein [Gorillibacterium timonense]
MSEGLSREAKRRWKQQAVQVLGEDFWDDLAGLWPDAGPRMDLYRDGQELVAVFELPGIAGPEAITVALATRWLTVSGETPYPYPVLEDELLRSERAIGRFSRRVALPEPVNPDAVQASYRQGLLTLRMRLLPETDSRTVAVEFGEDIPD